jgi:hypothetical protein
MSGANESFFEMEGASGSKSREGVVQWVVPYYIATLAQLGSIPGSYQGCDKVSQTWVCNNDGPTPSYTATVTYEGPDNESMRNNEYDKPVWSIDFDLQEMPIESHWNFEVIKQVYGGRADPNDPQSWIFPDNMPSGNGGGGTGLSRDSNQGAGKANPMKGVRTYIVMLTRVTKSYTRRSAPSVVDKIGTQSSNIPGAPASFNALGWGKRTWMQLPPQISKRGSVWQVTESWRLSEYHDWPDKVYIKFSSNRG